MSYNLNTLRDKLLCDLRTLNIDVEGFELVLKPFSKTYYGRYSPKNRRITLYVYSDEKCTKQYRYSQLFETTLHEVVHFIQWTDPDYVRVKGVMHNAEFYKIYNRLLSIHKRKRVLKRVIETPKIRTAVY